MLCAYQLHDLRWMLSAFDWPPGRKAELAAALDAAEAEGVYECDDAHLDLAAMRVMYEMHMAMKPPEVTDAA